MGVTKLLKREGNGTDKPKAGDTITSSVDSTSFVVLMLICLHLLVQYTGWLFDEKEEENKGDK